MEERLRGRQGDVDDGGAVCGPQGIAQDVSNDPGVLAGEMGKREGSLLSAQVVERPSRRRECVEHRVRRVV